MFQSHDIEFLPILPIVTHSIPGKNISLYHREVQSQSVLYTAQVYTEAGRRGSFITEYKNRIDIEH